MKPQTSLLYPLILSLLLGACAQLPIGVERSNNTLNDRLVTEQQLFADDFALPSDPKLIRKLPLPKRYIGVARKNIPDLISRIKAGFAMQNLNSAKVDGFIKQYAKQKSLSRVFKRGQPFLHDIVVELEKRNMPTELALLPIVESSFNTRARSHASAVGIWQFISSTGTRFGLRQNQWIDERQFTPKATVAAVEYLNWLYGEFDNWHLALAGYNCGENCVKRALKKTGRPFNKITYDSLPIPKETLQYAPRLQALKEILLQPKKYGIVLPIMANKKAVNIVRANVPIVSDMAAKLAGISTNDFMYLNAHLKKDLYHPKLSTDIIVPVNKTNSFLSNLSVYKNLANTWYIHRVARSQTLISIAKKYGSSLSAIRKTNPNTPNVIAKNTLLVIGVNKKVSRSNKKLESVGRLPSTAKARTSSKKAKKRTTKKNSKTASKKRLLELKRAALRKQRAVSKTK